MKYLLITSIFITFVLGSCDPGKQKEDKLSAGITVKWELIENTVSNGQDIFNARFIIENQGDRTLKSNWALFFSTNPRRLRPEDPSSPGVMKHINGDWHKLVPEADFELKPGETIDIPYSAGWCLIKKSNAPKGVYFVFYDDKGNEQKTEKVNCEVLPFVRPEQMTRGRGDLVPVPTPEGRYNDNMKLHLLSKDELTPVLPTPFAVKKYGEKIAVDNNWSIRWTGH
jgi:hexosaminidase